MDESDLLLDLDLEAGLPGSPTAPTAPQRTPLESARATPPPAVPPVNPLPAYGLTAAPIGSGGGGAVTARDLKAAGVGALVVLVFGWLARQFSR